MQLDIASIIKDILAQSQEDHAGISGRDRSKIYKDEAQFLSKSNARTYGEFRHILLHFLRC